MLSLQCFGTISRASTSSDLEPFENLHPYVIEKYRIPLEKFGFSKDTCMLPCAERLMVRSLHISLHQNFNYAITISKYAVASMESW
ncbi:unnamed protein product [Alternaria burnsii]|nr:unnamed protein product [Alternaria burnsii]